jgi:N6-adenosine-specific RNA methylase IME4
MSVVTNLAALAGADFGAILADPPWRFKTYSERGRDRSPDAKRFRGSPSRHYQTMTTKDIAALPVADLAAKDCCLFLWFSWPMLKDALAVIESWDFTYKTCAFSWTKASVLSQRDMFGNDLSIQIGCGYWTRSNNESCLFAVRGKPKRLGTKVRQAIIEPRRKHSQKPDCVHERIEQLVAGGYLELFARRERPGWTAWGKELPTSTAT